MLKKLLLFVALAALATLFFVFFSYDASTPLSPQKKTLSVNATAVADRVANTSAQTSPSGLDLAMKSINLSQGENGFELWRLRATAASIVKKDEFIFLTLPRLRYFMKDGTELKVVSDSGEIQQEQQIINFIDNVVVTRHNSTIRGPMLIYNGAAKTMTFPHGATFDEPDSSGQARTVIWHIDRKEIEGIGEVNVDFISEQIGGQEQTQ